MKRKIAWFLSAVMMFSSMPATSVNVLAESIQQTTASQTEKELSVQAESENDPAQTVSSEDFADNADAAEADLEDDEELSEDEEQEEETDSDFSDGEDDNDEGSDEDSDDEDDVDSDDEYEEVYLGENILDITTGKTLTWKFIAPEESTYKFHASSDMEFYMTVNDGAGDGDETNQFIKDYLEENETCRIEIRSNDENADSGQLKLIIKKICETHVPSAGSAVVTEPACEKGGYTTYTCQVCGETYTDDYVEPTGHQYEETGKQEPTCDEEGYTIYTCKICGDEEQDDYVDPLGHQYTETEKKDFTCTEDGYIRYACNVCGDEYEKEIPAHHNLDTSGKCTVCQEESPNKIWDAELADINGSNYVQFKYYTEEDCYAYVELYREDEEEPFFREGEYVSSENDSGEILTDTELPKYYIIKAYLYQEYKEYIISNTYVNLFHTKAFDNLDDYVPDYKDEHTVDLKDGNYGVFAEDTVVIHGNASENTLTDTSMDSDTYTLTNTDEQAKNITQGCNLAYFYDDELKLVVHVNKVTWKNDKTVSFTVSQPALEEVFEYLRIDSVIQNQECIVDLSGLPAGVSYKSATSSFSTQNAMDSVSEEGLESVGSNAANETKTTLSASQKYSFTALKIGAAEVNGDVSVEMKFPVKLYITHAQKMFQFGVEASLDGNISVKGEVSQSIPFGGYYVPVMNGIMYLGITPEFKLSADGSVSMKFGSKGNVQMQLDNYSGFQVLSNEFKNDDIRIEAEGNFFVGVELNPELFLVPKNKMITTSLSLGPQITATRTTPIPKEEQGIGDHSCQSCLDGEGNMIAELEAKVTAFKKEAKSTTTFKLKGLEFYYSFDHSRGGMGKCPYKNGEKDPEAEEELKELDELDDGIPDDDSFCTYEEICLDGFTYFCTFYHTGNSGVCVIEEVTESYYEHETFITTVTLPSSIDHHCQYNQDKIIPCKVTGIKPRVDTYVGINWIKHLIIPESVKGFERLGYLFPDIETVEIKGSKKLLCTNAFYPCEKLKTVKIPDGVISIRYEAFNGCSSLTNVEIPNSVKLIGGRAFAYCSSLTGIKIPDSVISIEDGAFAHCSSLTDVEIPDSVKYVGRPVFSDCTSLKRIKIGKNVDHVGDLIGEEYYDELGDIKYYCHGSCENIILSEGIEYIEADAFLYYRKLKHIEIPDSVKYIGREAFNGCENLQEISIPDGAKIGSMAFMNCHSLQKVRLPADLKEIRYNVFDGCYALKDIVLPDSVTSIGESAFKDCYALKKINIPDSVQNIKYKAFDNCDFEEMTIGKNAKIEFWIGEEDEFYGMGCSAETVYLTEGRTDIQDFFFFYGGLKKIVLPDSLKRIGKYAFEGCNELEKINLPEGLEEIEEGTFLYCYSLKSIVLPDSLKRIGKSAFMYDELEEINLPEGLEEIGEEAFSHCYTLKSIVIPDSVKTVGSNAFYVCENLKEITIGKDVSSKDLTQWGCDNYVNTLYLPDGMEEIKDNQFESLLHLKSVKIPDSVKRIGNYAFGGCISLEEINLPEGLEEIGESAFFLSSLVSVKIPDSVKTVGDYAFNSCFDLKQIVIAGKDTEISCLLNFEGERKNPDLKIYGLTGSHAERTAASDQNFIALEAIDKEGHGYVTDRVITPSTCSTPGEYVLKCIICENCGKTYTAEMPVSDNHEKIEKIPLVQASIGTEGKTEGSYCTACGKTVEGGETIPAIKAVMLSQKSCIYNGKVQKPAVIVTDSTGNKLTGESYSVKYAAGCTDTGTYAVKVTFRGNYKGSKSLSYRIDWAEQNITVKTSSKTYTYTAVKTKAKTFSIGASAKTALSYKSSNTKYVTVDKNGKVTVKKGTPGGTYTVTVTAAQNKNYNKASKTVVIKISQAAQSIKTKVSSKTYKYTAVKKRKQTFSIGASAKTTLSYKSSNAKYVTVNKKGEVTIKKGTPKGTYKITVKAAKNEGYKEATKTVTIKIS